MKQCMKCHRFLSNCSGACIYCSHKEIEELEMESPSYNPNYKLYAHEIIIDDRMFTIVKPIGRGGFGRVLKVLDNAAQKHFALKVPLIFDELFSNQKGKRKKDIEISHEFLEKEIAALTNLKDDAFIDSYKKGMVKTKSKGKTVVFPVLIMELADCTLEEILLRVSKGGENKFPYDEKIKIIKESLNAMSHLHNSGILHRDLSPDNLFAVGRDDKIAYVLGDFGAAKALNNMDSDSKPSEVVGHNAYLDPCRYNRQYNRDFRLDIYSLGIIITEILMGRLWTDVMGKENIHDFLAVDFEKDFLLQYGAEYITPSIIEALRKAVKRDIEKRYETIDDFRHALFDVLEKRPEEIESESGDPNTIAFPFYFSMTLPFELADSTFSQEIIRYNEGMRVELSDYRGTKIVFSDFLPEKVKIKNTSLYSAVISGNAVLLNFSNSKFMEIEKLIDEFEDEAEGELHFKGILEVEKVS